jgi:DNA-binding MarR family transcriptional regulator
MSAVVMELPMARVANPADLRKGRDLEDHHRLRAWRSSLRGFLRASKNILKQHDVTTLQYQSLLEIWEASGGRGLSVGELAVQLRVKHNSAVEVVNMLCVKKLTLRSRSEDDRRVVHVQLTPEGRALLAKLVNAHVRELDAIAPHMRKVFR